jgi:hypothetical protein
MQINNENNKQESNEIRRMHMRSIKRLKFTSEHETPVLADENTGHVFSCVFKLIFITFILVVSHIYYMFFSLNII